LKNQAVVGGFIPSAGALIQEKKENDLKQAEAQRQKILEREAQLAAADAAAAQRKAEEEAQRNESEASRWAGLAAAAQKRAEKQYDLTSWMPLVMNRNTISPELEDMEYYDDWRHPKVYDFIYPGTFMPARSIFSGLWLTELAGDFRTLNTGGGRWDIKLEMQKEFRTGTDEKDAAHILCSNSGTCRWVDYSTAGNVLYGVTAADVGVPRGISKLAGGLLEIWEGTVNWNNWRNLCEDPYDTKAVEFGYDLYKSTGGNITEDAFRDALTDEVLDSLQPPPEGFTPPFEAQPQPNAYLPDRFDHLEEEQP